MAQVDDQFKNALARAMRVVDGVGKGGVRHTLDTEAALVELVVLTIRSGEMRPACFLQHPAHLPEGNELRLLCNSDASKDEQLRADAHDWARVNYNEAAKASVSLRSALTAMRSADALLNDPDADEKLHEWKQEIAAYLRTTFGVIPERAPYDKGELDAWCFEMCDRANPVPKWLKEWRGKSKFIQREDTVAAEFARHMSSTEDEE